MVGLIGPIKSSTQALCRKNQLVIFLRSLLLSYLYIVLQKTLINSEKEEVLTKIHSFGLFVLYVQIQIGQIFTQSRKET